MKNKMKDTKMDLHAFKLQTVDLIKELLQFLASGVPFGTNVNDRTWVLIPPPQDFEHGINSIHGVNKHSYSKTNLIF